MAKTATSRYGVAEHLRSPEEMAAYLEACLEEAEGDAPFIAKGSETLPVPSAWPKWPEMPDSPVKVFTRHFPASAVRVSTRSSRSSGRSD